MITSPGNSQIAKKSVTCHASDRRLLSNMAVQDNKNGVALGIYTKSASSVAPQGIEPNPEKSQEQKTYDFAAVRFERYALQEVAGKLLPKERVCKCLKFRISKRDGVGIKYNTVRGKAHYDNVVRCGSVWTCPVCAAKISEERGKELKKAIAQHRKNGGAVYLLTLTNPHYYGDDLSHLIDRQKVALKYFFSDRKPKEMLKSLGKIGHITALEVTHGRNGWHPHYHILVFFDHTINLSGLRSFFYDCWANACRKAKLPIPSYEHGLDLQDGSYADRYVSKWGLDKEMTKGHIKKSHNDNKTPFDLLRMAEQDEKAGRLFVEFAKAFRGRRQLSWTKGLKKLLLIEEKTDEELAQETEQNAIHVQTLDLYTWMLIKHLKIRSEVLRLVELDMLDGGTRLSEFLIGLLERDMRSRERYLRT